jgi:hypothetical protein
VRRAASAEFNRRGARSESYESLSSGGEFSGNTGCTSRYRIDSDIVSMIRTNEVCRIAH